MRSGDPMVAEKLGQVPELLKEHGLDAWLLFVRESHTLHDPCLDLVVGTNVTWPSAFLLTATGDRVAIVGALDKANLESHGHYPEIIGYGEGITEHLRRTLARLNPRRIALDYSVNDPMADGLTHGQFLMLSAILEGTPFPSRIESSERLVGALRGRKSPTERARIRAACEVTVEIFGRLTGRLRAGLTERQVAALIVEEMDRIGDLGLAWDPEHCPAVFTGPDSAGAHAGPTDRPIEPGHVMNVDFGVSRNGYCSDLQRTWYFLRASESVAPAPVRRGFETIVEAIQEAARAVRPGRTGAEIDGVARSYITARGFPEYPHGLGHQIGRTAHDGGAGLFPRWERYGNLPDVPIEAGQCFTIEPRLPIEGHGIATCEEIVVVTEDGHEFLSEPQRELYLIPAR
jgi:Xaa-Pro aminopeptidase